MAEKKLMKGNEATVHAAIKAGCRFYAGYPITPQIEVPETMAVLMPKVKGIFIQAESEIAAINMLFGASAVGFRCMTSSSSPGISLKQEGISYIAGGELPCVILNVVRGGPGLGNIRASQADYFQATKGGGHGDYRLIVLAPGNLQEFYDMTMDAFDYADHYRNPVMLLTDGIMGQMIEPIVMKDYKPKFRQEKKDYILEGCKGREPRVVRTLMLSPPDRLEKHNIHLDEKYKKIESELCLCEEYKTDDADIIVAAYGTTARVCKEAVDIVREEGMKAGLVRPKTLWPFPYDVFKKHKGKDILVVEMSNGQFIEDVRLGVECRGTISFLGHGGGWYPDTDKVLNKLRDIR